jgi:hypothetical protein
LLFGSRCCTSMLACRAAGFAVRMACCISHVAYVLCCYST